MQDPELPGQMGQMLESIFKVRGLTLSRVMDWADFFILQRAPLWSVQIDVVGSFPLVRVSA